MPYCTRCGSEVSAQESFCSNCGQPRNVQSQTAVVAAAVEGAPAPAQSERVESLAVASLIVGIAGLFQVPIPVVPNIVAIVLGMQARAKIRETPGLTGEGLAMAGIVLAIVGLVIAVVLILAVLLFFSALVNSA